VKRRTFALAVAGAVAGGGVLARALPTPRLMPVAASPAEARFLAAVPGWGLPGLGATAAPLHMVNFFDYHCPYCRAMDPYLPALVSANPDLRLMFADYPILAPDSALAAQLALAAARQGRYWAAHQWLMGQGGTYSLQMAAPLAAAIGADPQRLAKDATAPDVIGLLHRSLRAGAALGIDGTPALVSATGLIEGFQGPAALQTLVGRLRSHGTQAAVRLQPA
jgi:protein-disulfide isomerase